LGERKTNGLSVINLSLLYEAIKRRRSGLSRSLQTVRLKKNVIGEEKTGFDTPSSI